MSVKRKKLKIGLKNPYYTREEVKDILEDFGYKTWKIGMEKKGIFLDVGFEDTGSIEQPDYIG